MLSGESRSRFSVGLLIARGVWQDDHRQHGVLRPGQVARGMLDLLLLQQVHRQGALHAVMLPTPQGLPELRQFCWMLPATKKNRPEPTAGVLGTGRAGCGSATISLQEMSTLQPCLPLA